MESKLNHQAIDAYSKALAKQLSQSFFSNSSHISGKEILELSPNKQINLMVLKNLFRKWKKENAKLQSPYFDYHSDEVKKAMKDFMNTLSRHIYVKKEHFEPLLKESIKDSVLLAFSPYDFYSKEINQRDDSRLRLSDLKDLKKYIKFNEFLLDGLIEHFESHKEDVVFNDTAFEMFNEVCSNSEEQPADIQPLLAEFSKTLPLSLADIYLEEDKDQTGILNEKLQSKDKQTLADKLAKSGGKSIMKMLTLNQRFMFVNELFEGNQNQFLSAVEQIDGMESYKEASSHIKKSFADKYNWDMETEEVQEFIELVEKRFGA
jgi:energy-converting hydrogenase A subunit M